MWWKIMIVWAVALVLAVLFVVIFYSARARKEYDLFLNFVGGIRHPVRAYEELDGETFVGGSIFFKDGKIFTFKEEVAFRRAVRQFHLEPQCGYGE